MLVRIGQCLARSSIILSVPVAAQTTVAVPPLPVGSAATVPQQPGETFVEIPADTVVRFDIVDSLSSKTAAIDQRFAIRLVDPVVINGATVLPTGILGEGQVVHAAKARAMGKAGELIIAARFLDCGGTQIALRGFRFPQRGADNANGAFLASMIVAPIGFLVSGGESKILPKTLGTAKIAQSAKIRIAPVPECIAPASAAGPIEPVPQQGGVTP